MLKKKSLLTVIFLMILGTVFAQRVQVSFTIIPPFSPYVSDYSKPGKTLITLQNLGNTPLQVKLGGSFTSLNGVVIKTKTNFQPPKAILLGPLEVKQMTASEISNIFDPNYLDVTGIDKNTVIRTNRLPEGNYTACVQAFDFNTGQPLSTASFGCTQLDVFFPDAPVLLTPLQGDSVQNLSPQNISFSWMTPGTPVRGADYTIQIAEMPSPRANPDQVLKATSFPVLSQTVKRTDYNYSIANLALKPGRIYAWRVISSDPSGRTTFKNNGISDASVFSIASLKDPGQPKEEKTVQKAYTPQMGFEVTGNIKYQYHKNMNNFPAGFTGIKTDALGLSGQDVELLYGYCKVKMDLKKVITTQNVAKSFIKENDIKEGPLVKFVSSKGDSTLLEITRVDSIPLFGMPLEQISSAGINIFKQSDPVAKTTTDSLGNFKFSQLYVTKKTYIDEVLPDGKTAMIYCYYINVKNKHYTDPKQFIYVPDVAGRALLNIGTAGVFINNYKLIVTANRENEKTLDAAGKQGISVENKNDGTVDFYLLRRIKENVTGAVPQNEGDNIGKPLFVSQSDIKPSFTKFYDYSIVSKSSEKLTTSGNNVSITSAATVFNNLPYNLSQNEHYYIYAEMRGAGVYFEPKEYMHSDDVEEYNPDPAPSDGYLSADLSPSFVSIKVKGVLKYKFKNGMAQPLGNVSISLRGAQYDQLGLNGLPAYYYNATYSTVTTKANGYFEMDAGLMNYKDYKSGNADNSNANNFRQLIIVNNPYYGSPDKAYQLEAGNSYNLGDVIAEVKDFSLKTSVAVVNGANLKGMRTYVCRLATANTAQWGIPADEGNNKGVAAKEILDANQVKYKVVGYGETDNNGLVVFDNLVATDIKNNADRYYIYTESAITSLENYSSQYGVEAHLYTDKADEKHYSDAVLFNSIIEKQTSPLQPKIVFAKAQTPFVEGAVYPETNASTSAIPGVNVDLYTITDYNYATFINAAESYQMEAVLAQLKGKISAPVSVPVDPSGFFHYDLDPQTADSKTWRFLVFSKAGFSSGYATINAGKVVMGGFKQNIKGLMSLPKKVKVTVKDERGMPVQATIIAGTNFSWGKTTVSPNDNIASDTLLSPKGIVDFTVVPEDQVHYQTKQFTRTVTPGTSATLQTLDPFVLPYPQNYISITLVDAAQKIFTPLDGTIQLTDLPDNENPAKQPRIVMKKSSVALSFISDAYSYKLVAKSQGYATQVITIKNNTGKEQLDIKVMMEPAINLTGKVTMDKKGLKDAKVYIKELEGVVAEVYTDAAGFYTISDLPLNHNTVTVVADKASANTIAVTQKVVLETPAKNNNPAPSGGNVGGAIKGVGNINMVNTATANFDLSASTLFDLTSLYGFPLEVESLEKRATDYKLNGRILISHRGNDTSAFTGTEPVNYLHVSNVSIKQPGTPKAGLVNEGGIKNAGAIVPGNKGGVNANGPAAATNIGEAPRAELAALEATGGSVEIDEDAMPIKVFGKYRANLVAISSPIILQGDKNDMGKGTVLGTVVLLNDNIVANVNWSGGVSLTPTLPGIVKKGKGLYDLFEVILPVEKPIAVFVSSTNMNGSLVGKYKFMSDKGGLNFRLNKSYNAEAATESYIAADGLHLFTILHTKLEHVETPDLNLSVGELIVTNTDVKPVKNSTPIKIPIDGWSIQSNNWSIGYGVLKLNGSISTGAVNVPFKDLEVSETTIGFGDMDLDNLTIAGAQKLVINKSKTFTSFGYDVAARYGTLYDTKNFGCWSLSLLPINIDEPLTTLTGLQDLKAGDEIGIKNIALYSKGNESRIQLQPGKNVTLNDFAIFTPAELQNGNGFLKIVGSLNINIPGMVFTSNTAYNLNYTNDGNGNLVHQHEPIEGLKMSTNGVRVEFAKEGQVFTKGKLVMNGLLYDKVPSSPYAFNVQLIKDNNGTVINLVNPEKNKLNMGKGQTLVNITGSMNLAQATWKNLKFAGTLSGAEGIADTSHLFIEVKGDLVVNKGALGIANMPMPGFGDGNGGGTFNIYYDFNKSALIGSIHFDQIKTPQAEFSADIEMQIGGDGWYFLGSANISKIVTCPFPLNSAGGAFLVGNTTITKDMMQVIQPVFHNAELPDDFEKNYQSIKGTLFVAAIDVKLPLPLDLDIDVLLANVHTHYGLYANTYSSVGFDQKVIVAKSGVKVGAYVSISAGASIGLACAGVSLGIEENMQNNMVIKMPPLSLSTLTSPKEILTKSEISMEWAPAFILKGEAYIGGGVCNSSCESVSIWGVTVPPGCYKVDIGGDLKISPHMKFEKPAGAIAINGYIWISLLGSTFPKDGGTPAQKPNYSISL